MERCKKKRSPIIARTRAQWFTVQGPSPPGQKEEKDEKYILELKPFADIPHIIFNKVKVGDSKVLTLDIHNPLHVPQSVLVEKFPSKKGFSIDTDCFYVPPTEQVQIQIQWKPEKSLSCREIILFKSSEGCRAQAYLHGTAFSPKQQKKRRKWNKNSLLPNLKCPSENDKENESCIPGNGKEHLTSMNSKTDLINDTEVKFPLASAANFYLPVKSTDIPGSPIRRQTYNIQSIQEMSHTRADNNIPVFPLNETKVVLKEKNAHPILECTANVSKLNVFSQKDQDVDTFHSEKQQVPFYLFSPQTKDNSNFILEHDKKIKSLYQNLDEKLQRKTVTSDVFDNNVNSSGTNQNFPLETKARSVEDLNLEVDDTDGKSLSCNSKDALAATNLCTFEIGHDIPSEPESLSSLHFSNSMRLPPKSKHKTPYQPKKKFSTDLLRKKLNSTGGGETHVKDTKTQVDSRGSEKCERKKSRYLPQRLTLTKIKATDRICQRNPFATLNVYYDEYWKEKQEMAFTNWLNFILTPNDDFRSSEEVQVNSAEIWIASMKDAGAIHAPSKEELSFKTYTAAKQLNRLRKSACLLYQSTELAETIKKVEKEVDSKKICVRKDRDTHADLGIKKLLMEMLLSYNPLWLRVGLETVYGEMIPLQNNRDVFGLSRFIIHRFLSNPDIASKYAHASVLNYYKPGYEDAMKRFTLKKFLLLVYFLDVAKRAYLIDHNPCLFCKTSKYKCSRNLLLTFSREYLSGEGDITKHLRYLGYIVKYEQTAIEEFNYSVKNIAVDLRCGLRLGRAVELLLQDFSISKGLRLNTLNRLAKIHNNEVILKSLQNASIDIEGNIDARDIVDGNREKTLSLLWQIIFKTQVSKNVNLEELKKENSYLRRSLKLKADFAAFNALQMLYSESENFEIDFLNSKLYKENEVIQQLFQWSQNVCAHYGVKVYNFTSSFSDGRALCFLLHHYHPNLLPSDSIKKETTNSYFEKQMEKSEDENCPYLPENRQMKSNLMAKLLKNEKENLDLFFQKAQEIGNIPVLSFPSHLSNTLPDEKVIITLVSYINICLMELSVEIRAARTILLAYQKWKLRKQHEKLKVQIDAAIVIQRYWRKLMQMKKKKIEENAAVIIQKNWKMYSAMKQLKDLKYKNSLMFKSKKAVIIQAAYRGYRIREYLKECQKSSVIIQSHVRKWLARKHYLRLKEITLKITSNYQAKILGRIERQKFVHLKTVVTHLQALIRGKLLRKQIRTQVSAATIIQSCVKMWLARKYYLKLKHACICIQQKFRSLQLLRQCMTNFQNLRQSAIIIQRWYLNIKRKQLEYKSAVKIQAFVRKCLLRKKYLRLYSSVITLQLWWKAVIIAKKTLLSYLEDRKHIICIQALVRRNIAQKAYKRKIKAIILIQTHVRKMIQQNRFHTLKTNALLIQKWWRNILLSQRVRKAYLVYKHSVVKIQSAWRMYYLKSAFKKLKKSVSAVERYRIGKMQRIAYLRQRENIIKVQSLFRSYKCRKQWLIERKSILTIQRSVRTYIIRQKFLKIKASAIKIQRYYRSYRCMCLEHQRYIIMKMGFTRLQAVYHSVKVREEIRYLHEKAILIQKYYKMWIAKKYYVELKKACIVIQQRYRAQLKMKKQLLEYKQVQRSVMLIQANVRRCRIRKRFLLMKEAVIKIQSFVRMVIAREAFCVTRQKIVLIQQYYRAKQLMNNQVQIYSETRKKVILLQSVVRCLIIRKKYLKLKSACTLIQSIIRMHSLHARYIKLHQATVTIQRRFRSLQIANKQKCEYLTMRTACIKIQTFFRMVKHLNKFRKIHNSSILIQRHFRAFLVARKVRENFFSQKHNCIKIQAYIRMYLQRKKFLKEKSACITIQSYVKMYITRKKFLNLKQSVCILQKYINAWKMAKQERENFLKMKVSTITIQASFRGYISRKNFKMQKKACIKIQAHARKFICQTSFVRQKNAAEILQKHFKATMLAKQVRKSFLYRRNCIIKVQAHVRGWLTRKLIQKLHQSATKIQSSYKCHVSRTVYLGRKKSALQLQRSFRAHLFRNRVHLNCLKLRSSATTIQAAWRGFNARQELARKIKATILLQSHIRKIQQRRKFLSLRNSAIVLQQHYKACQKGLKDYQSYQFKRKSCIKIQSVWKGVLLRRKLEVQRKAAVCIQQRFCLWMSKKAELQASWIKTEQQHLWYSHLRCNTIQFQRQARKYLLKRERAVILLQSYMRMWLCQKQYKREKAALRIQTLWRGYVIRKNITDPKIITSMKSIKSSEINVYSCLKNRTTRALQTLLIDRNLRNILSALQNLDVCTQLSPTCCERLEQSGGLSVLVQLVSSCNRSIPHKEVIKFSTNILLNLAKYTKTVNSVWAEPDVLNMLLNLMRIFREKGVPIFTKCCTLFYIFGQDPEKAEVLKESPDFLEQIKSFHYLLLRKQAIEEKRAKSSTSAKVTHTATVFVKKYRAMNPRESLHIDPDWLLGRHRKREFKDPLIAITSLMHILDLEMKEQ